MFWKTKYKQESREDFKAKIEQCLFDLADNKIPAENVAELSEYMTSLIYERYKNDRKKYPKSRKRYAELKIEDLNSPYYQHRILDFLKAKTDNNYIVFARQILGLSESEFMEFEKRKVEFENM